MLFQATLIVIVTAMTTCLWMAFYLLARGFPSKITLRGVAALLALSITFFGGANNLFLHHFVSPAWRAVMLIIAMVMWYSITLQLLPLHTRRSISGLTFGLYTLACITAIALIGVPTAFVPQGNNLLYVARMQFGPPYVLYAAFQILVSAGILYNLLSHNKVGLTLQGRYFLYASIFPILAIGYGILALAITPPMPRVVTDILTFGGVFILGISVARYQTWIERRTTLDDFPVTTLTVLGISLLYVVLSLQIGLPPEWIPNLAAFAVLTHSVYDLVRELVDRNRLRKESLFRKQLHQLETEIAAKDTLAIRLQEALDLLCRTIDASGGLIAVRAEEQFIVAATRYSVPLDSTFALALLSCEDVSASTKDQIPLAWLAPSFDGHAQIAVLGLTKPKGKLEYSSGDLDLLAEVADQIGTLVTLSTVRPKQDLQLQQLVAEQYSNVSQQDLVTSEIVESMAAAPEPEFIRILEEALRHLPDVIALGQSALADRMALKAESQIERGKWLQKMLNESIELLRPEEKRPSEPLPRVWYNYAVLHDAYVEGVPNREIMARLYVSEGTFNRTRRNAIRGLARLLTDKMSR